MIAQRSRHDGIGVVGLLLIAGAILCANGAAAQNRSDDRDAERRLLDASQRLLNEERVQNQVNTRLDRAARQIETLVEDLVSNGLFHETGGAKLERMKRVIERLKRENVPGAAAALREARRNLLNARPHLENADGQVHTVIRELERLLERAQSVRAEEQLLTDLRALAEQQEQLQERTKEWGRETFTDPERAGQQREPLARQQRDMAERLREFEEQIDEVREQTQDPRTRQKLDEASDAMERRQPERQAEQAAESIDQTEPIASVEAQQEVLEALREAERALSADVLAARLAEMRDTFDELSSLRDQQQELREQIESSSMEEFEAAQRAFQAEQRELSGELGETMERMPPMAKPEPLDQAAEDMAEAEQQIEALEQAPTTEAQMEAEQHLDEAMRQVEQVMAELRHRLEQQAEPPMEFAAAEQQPQQPHPAEQSQQQQQQQQQQQMQQPQMTQQQQSDDRPQPPLPTTTDAAGEDAAKTRAAWTALGEKERARVYENYARQLPVEYRALLQDYYEELSR